MAEDKTVKIKVVFEADTANAEKAAENVVNAAEKTKTAVASSFFIIYCSLFFRAVSVYSSSCFSCFTSKDDVGYLSYSFPLLILCSIESFLPSILCLIFSLVCLLCFLPHIGLPSPFRFPPQFIFDFVINFSIKVEHLDIFLHCSVIFVYRRFLYFFKQLVPSNSYCVI